MKRPFFTLVTTGVLCAALTTGAFAGPPTADSQKAGILSRLEERTQRLEQHAQTTKGAGRQEFELQRLRVRELINKMKAGEAVDPQEIDMLLRKAPQ